MEYKNFEIIGDGTFGYKAIKQKGSGTVPVELRGVYTSGPIAKRAIDAYVSKKEKTDGRKKSTAGSK